MILVLVEQEQMALVTVRQNAQILEGEPQGHVPLDSGCVACVSMNNSNRS